MLDSSCWLPTTSRDYDSNRKHISSHPVRITARARARARARVCVCVCVWQAPWRKHRTKWPASYYCCYLTSLFTPYFRCLTPRNYTTVCQSDSDRRHGTVPAPKSNRYGSVTREFHVQICICLLYVVYGQKMHLRLYGTRTHADRSVTADGLCATSTWYQCISTVAVFSRNPHGHFRYVPYKQAQNLFWVCCILWWK